MVRLIACDMDGTLLDSEKRMPPDFPEIMRELRQHGVMFAVASGRSYVTLKQQFKDYLDDIIFICDNGAYVVYKHDILSVSLLPSELLKELILVCRSFNGKMLLCGKNGTYHEYFGSNDAEEEIANYYINQVVVDDVLKVKDDIFKIALYDEQGSEEHACIILYNHFGNRINGQASGKYWMDIMDMGVNKGAALCAIQQKLSISKEESMVFGDYLNDYELLLAAGESFAMENGHPECKKIAKYVAPSNDEQGVIKMIKKYVL